jgi:hypothetical protein
MVKEASGREKKTISYSASQHSFTDRIRTLLGITSRILWTRVTNIAILLGGGAGTGCMSKQPNSPILRMTHSLFYVSNSPQQLGRGTKLHSTQKFSTFGPLEGVTTPTTVHLRHIILSYTYPGDLPLIRSASSPFCASIDRRMYRLDLLYHFFNS